MIDLRLMATSAVAAALAALNLVQHRRLHIARHDPLTGLAARRLWTACAERATRHPQGLVVLIVDGDEFKQINDRYGHEAGDALLAAFARRLKAWTGGRGLAGRLGGDEFAVFVRLADTAHLGDRLDALCMDLAAPVHHRDRTLRAGASIGAVIVEELAAPTLHHAMRAADEALYQAKSAGRGTWRLAERPPKPVSVDIAPVRRIRTQGIASAYVHRFAGPAAPVLSNRRQRMRGDKADVSGR
jgi:diguanylate cyclase